MKSTNAIRCTTALAVALLATSADAAVVNINTQFGANPYQEDLGAGVFAVGTVLTLGQGDYVITPISANTGGSFTAANRFNAVNLPLRGWEWNYYISIDGQTATKIGFGEGQPAVGGDYQASPEAAFALASSHSFSLASASNVTFYWLDDNFSDNLGGISLDVSAVPTPGGLFLMLSGLGLVAQIARRKQV